MRNPNLWVLRQNAIFLKRCILICYIKLFKIQLLLNIHLEVKLQTQTNKMTNYRLKRHKHAETRPLIVCNTKYKYSVETRKKNTKRRCFHQQMLPLYFPLVNVFIIGYSYINHKPVAIKRPFNNDVSFILHLHI